MEGTESGWGLLSWPSPPGLGAAWGQRPLLGAGSCRNKAFSLPAPPAGSCGGLEYPGEEERAGRGEPRAAPEGLILPTGLGLRGDIFCPRAAVGGGKHR